MLFLPNRGWKCTSGMSGWIAGGVGSGLVIEVLERQAVLDLLELTEHVIHVGFLDGAVGEAREPDVRDADAVVIERIGRGGRRNRMEALHSHESRE